MKLSFKTILPILLIFTLLILLTGCFITPSDEQPGYTPGTITGTIAAPCCSTSADPVTEPSCVYPEYWCCYCEDTWSLQDGVEVVLTYGVTEVATTTTNEDGEYTFTNVPPAKNYVITAFCPDYDDDRPLVKDVALKVEEGETFDTEITDCVSTALGLVVDYLVENTTVLGPEEIVLDGVIAGIPNFYGFPEFKKLVLRICEIAPGCVDLFEDEKVPDYLCRAAQEIGRKVIPDLDLGCGPGYTPGPPPTDPCAGNIAPTISAVLIDGNPVSVGGTVHVIAGVTYVITVNASDDGIRYALTYSATANGTTYGPVSSNVINITPIVVGEYSVSVSVNDGCTSTPWGPIEVIVCPLLNEALAITISDETPCYGTCVTISKITVSYTDGVTPNLEIVPTYVGKNLTWDVDPGITFNPADGTVCLDENNDGQVGVDYHINFTYTDECGGIATATGTATINFNVSPTADAKGPYSGDAICGNKATIHLDGSDSSAGDADIASWEWFDGTTSLGKGETLNHDFDPGKYDDITLEVTDANGCTDIATTTVTVNEICTLDEEFVIAFEDLKADSSADWDYDDFVGTVNLTYHKITFWNTGTAVEKLAKIDFTMISHDFREAGHSHKLHLIIDGYDDTNPQHSYTTGVLHIPIYSRAGNDFLILEPTSSTVGKKYDLYIDFGSEPVSYGTLEVDTANYYHGNDALPFTFYLWDNENGNIGDNNDDIRKLVVPIGWNQPDSTKPLWDYYNKTGNDITGAGGIPVIPKPMDWLDF